jgi:hypothetical protein
VFSQQTRDNVSIVTSSAQKISETRGNSQKISQDAYSRKEHAILLMSEH